jgi:uncharacterized protein
MHAAPSRLLTVLVTALSVIGLISVQAAAAPAAQAATVSDPVGEAIAASGDPHSGWHPDPARYGVVQKMNVPVRMKDGTVLRATVAYPADKATGRIAPGRFPTLLTMTPYGAATGVSATGADPYFVQRGYLDIAVDVRGTGTSQGDFDLFNPKQTRDAVQLIDWAAGLPESTGKVGLHGASYLGIDQLLAAAAVGRNSPLKAIFPFVAANDIYRDTAFMGGIPDFSFDSAYFVGVLPGVNIADPVISTARDPRHTAPAVAAELHRATQIPANDATFLAGADLGGPNAYDNGYWRDRSPGTVLDRVVANGIPAYLVGGHYDLFQRGEPLNYAGLQNAAAGRPVGVPMVPGQHVTGRYQLLMGPYTHLGGATAPLHELQLRWFDQWLEGRGSGMDRTDTPLHVYDLGTQHYTEHSHFPYTSARPTTFYLGGPGGPVGAVTGLLGGTGLPGGGGTLSRERPGGTGADTVVWSPAAATSCSRTTDQWTAGALSSVTGRVPANLPCVDDDRLAGVGPTSRSYDSAPMDRPTTVAGPIAATVYATATTTDSEWVVLVEDVAPDGGSRTLTEGALLGSLRARDDQRSWSVDGRTVIPHHPYTQASERPVTPGALTRYDVEVFPTYATIARGHRIRVTLSTADFPHLLPTVPALARLAGGVYQVHRDAAGPSSVTIPLR